MKLKSKGLSVAQNSTASMGQFDRKAHPKEELNKKTKKRKLIKTFKSAKEEN